MSMSRLIEALLPAPRRGVCLSLGLGVLGAWMITSPAAAQTLTGTATVEVTVDADDLHDQLERLHDRLDAAEADREALRRALDRLGQPPDASGVSGEPEQPGAPLPGPPLASVAGFSMLTPSADSRVVYVSARGNDNNHGLSPDAPLRTPRAGYARLRDGFPDHLLFFAGDVFTGNLGAITKSGRSAQEPMVIGAYVPPGFPDAPRPILMSPGSAWARKEFNARGSHLVFRGLHILPVYRDPARPDFNPDRLGRDQWNQAGLQFFGDARNITVEDCKLERFKFALVFQSDERSGPLQNVRVHRTVVADSFGHWNRDIAGHSSGLFARWVDGLTITDSVFDHNGWHPDVSGAGKTKFNHNVYVQRDCRNVSVRNTVFARASSHGMQLRSGGNVEDSLFVDNALAFYVARHESLVRDNVVLHSTDLGDGPDDRRGQGIETLPCVHARLVGNIVSQKRGTARHAPAIGITWAKEASSWLDGRDYRVTLDNNRVYDWPRNEGRDPSVHVGTPSADVVGLDTNQLDPASGGRFDPARWLDPERDVETYAASLGLEPTLDAFLQRARNRPLGTWDPRFTAAGVNAHVREGFTEKPSNP
ncbi:MAG: right-handed parallel beta-helix repeat-containing protein [Planctomycetota bacterium]